MHLANANTHGSIIRRGAVRITTKERTILRILRCSFSVESNTRWTSYCTVSPLRWNNTDYSKARSILNPGLSIDDDGVVSFIAQCCARQDYVFFGTESESSLTSRDLSLFFSTGTRIDRE